MELIKGVQEGLAMLDEFDVYDVAPLRNADGKDLVSSRGEAKLRGDGTVKWRFVGREFKWMEVRDDVFSPGSSINTSRTIDLIAAKETWPSFTADGVSAYYQTPEQNEKYTIPPKEWMWIRQQKNLDVDVCWRLKRKLPGTRDAGAAFVSHLAVLFGGRGLERNEAFPPHLQELRES